jgi:hypothetical protein
MHILKRLFVIVTLVTLSLAVYFSLRANVKVNNFIRKDTEHTGQLNHHILPQGFATQAQQPKPTDRGRVQIANNTVVADNGFRLHGEHLRMSFLEYEHRGEIGINMDRAYDLEVWQEFVERYHLNTVRLLLYRPPQKWSDEPDDCPPVGRCFNTVQEAIPYLDDMVETASMMGMYVIIDYHPVGGYYKDDAIAWWNALAPRYKERTHVVYELSNEPVMWSAGSYQQEDIEFEEELYQLIRGHAPDTHIILWSFAEASGNGDSMLTQVNQGSKISYDNASVGYHPYKYNQNELNALKNAGYAVIDTEIGGYNRFEYLNRTTTEESFGVSWIWLDGTGFEKEWVDNNPIPVTWPKDPKTISFYAYLPSILKQL